MKCNRGGAGFQWPTAAPAVRPGAGGKRWARGQGEGQGEEGQGQAQGRDGDDAFSNGGVVQGGSTGDASAMGGAALREHFDDSLDSLRPVGYY